MTADLKPVRQSMNKMASDVLAAAQIDFDQESQLNQALVGTFVFGMISAAGTQKKLQPPEVHALALSVYIDTFHYTEQAAAEGTQNCIMATRPGYHDTMHAILHRGIDGHRQYEKGDLLGVSRNLLSILDQFKNEG